MQPAAPTEDGGPNFVLLAKATPIRVMKPADGSLDSKTSALNTRGFNSLIVDVIPGPNSGTTSITILGAPTPGGPWIQEVDGQAFQSGFVASAAHRFIVTGISTWVAVALTAPADWTVWLTPFNAAAQTNVTVTGTTSQNLAQYGGTAIGPANPVDTRVADGANAALGVTSGAANTTGVGGTVQQYLRGLVTFFAAIASLTFGWLRVQAQPTTWNLVATSGANAAVTATQAAAGAGVKNYLTGLTVSWSGGAPAAGTNVQVKDGATVIWDTYIGAAGALQGSNDFEFTGPLASSANAALAVVVAAGGGAVTTKVSGQGTVGP